MPYTIIHNGRLRQKVVLKKCKVTGIAGNEAEITTVGAIKYLLSVTTHNVLNICG
jgi:hypothetical protein